jgi:hypothetical protein
MRRPVIAGVIDARKTMSASLRAASLNYAANSEAGRLWRIIVSNVIAIEKPQPESKPARFKIAVELEGLPVEIEIEGKADNLKALVERLKAIGAQPPTGKAGSSNGSAPLCPVHNKPMKPSRKPGSFFCPKRDADGEYCDQKA